MLDLSYIREHQDEVKGALKIRAPKLDFGSFLELDKSRRKLLQELDALRAQKNQANDKISLYIKEKKDPKETIASMKATAIQIDQIRLMDHHAFSEFYVFRNHKLSQTIF